MKLGCGINLQQVKMMEVRCGEGYLFDAKMLPNPFVVREEHMFQVGREKAILFGRIGKSGSMEVVRDFFGR